MQNKEKKQYIKQIIRETISVIFGVLIALFINNWNDDRKERKYLDQIFSSINKELEESVSDIKQVIPIQLASIDTIDVYLNNDKISLYDIVIKSNGIQSPTIKTNSWNAIANSKIELIDYKRLSSLANIEERKNNLTSRIKLQMDFTFKNFEETDRRKKEILKMMIIDVVGAEKRLLSKIKEVIKNTSATNKAYN